MRPSQSTSNFPDLFFSLPVQENDMAGPISLLPRFSHPLELTETHQKRPPTVHLLSQQNTYSHQRKTISTLPITWLPHSFLLDLTKLEKKDQRKPSQSNRTQQIPLPQQTRVSQHKKFKYHPGLIIVIPKRRVGRRRTKRIQQPKHQTTFQTSHIQSKKPHPQSCPPTHLLSLNNQQ